MLLPIFSLVVSVVMWWCVDLDAGLIFALTLWNLTSWVWISCVIAVRFCEMHQNDDRRRGRS